jgi:photosystem II stability/assembly factor-like uncharacterized protein
MKPSAIFRFVVVICTCLGSSFLHGQRHLELIGKYQGDFRKIDLEMEQGYASGIISARDYKHYGRWKMYVEPRLSPSGHIMNTAAKNQEEHRKYVKSHPAPASQTRITHGLWTTVSPSQFDGSEPRNGRLNCIAVHPTSNNIIYVGAALSGLWRTTDGGTTWTCLTDGLPVIGVSSIVINPFNADNIFILTGDGDARSIPSIGILESFDGGFNWTETGLKWGVNTSYYGYKILMNPNHPDSMYVVTDHGLFRTSDGWQTADPELEGHIMRDIEFKPGSTTILYASSSKDVNPATFFRSTDGGDTWNDLGAGGYGLPSGSFFTRAEIAVSPDDPQFVNVLYAATDTFNLFRSFTGADAFILISNQPNIVNGQVNWDLVMVADPTDATEVFVGGVALWKSSDYGQGTTWNQIANGAGLPSVHADIHALYHDGSLILVATDGGISKSTNGGISWQNLTEGMNLMQYYAIDVLPSTSTVMGGSQDNGTTKWQVGDTEANMILGSDGMVCMFHPTSTNAWYVSSQTNRWRWDAADSAAWTFITPPGDTFWHWQASWLMHPTNPDTLYSAWRNISRTYNRGDDWEDLNPGFTTNRNIMAMVQGINNVHRLYASDGLTVRRTSNLHSSPPTWTDVTNNLRIGSGVGVLGALTVAPESSLRVWATILRYEAGNKVYYSDDGGATWSNISGTLPNVPVNCIEYHAGSSDGLYIGTDLGVFYRNADMTDWIYFSNGLPNVPVLDIKLTGSYVYAGTYGRGMWRSEHYTSCPVASALTPANDPSSSISTGTQHYSASLSITSTRIITGGPGSDVTYQAGNFVRLDPGFHAKTNNELHVKVEGCPD